MRHLILTFFLVACGVQPSYQPPAPAPAPVPAPAPAPSCNDGKVTWDNAAKSVVDKHCASCHQAYGQYGAAKAKINGILERVNNGSMPPPPRFISRDEIKILEQWKADGLIEKCEKPAPSNGSFKGFKEREIDAFFDARSLNDGLDPELKKNTRYVDICHIPGELKEIQQGIDKFLNSLSSERNLARVQWLGDAQCLGRYDIRNYGWNAAIYEILVARNTTSILSRTDEGKFLQDLTGTALPIMKGDVLIFAGSVAPTYYQVLGLPATLAALEQFADVNKAINLAEKTVKFAGVTGSIVAKNNRLLTIWKQTNRNGTFRESFDFQAFNAQNPQRNLFAFPGKQIFGFTQNFLEGGGEIIFTLENGLQAYAIIDAQGRLINEAPIDVVFDPVRNEAVKAGISCMSCHNEGPKVARDQIRASVLANPANFNSNDVELVKDFYVSHGNYDATTGKIRGQFDDALRLLGFSIADKEPIGAIFAQYEKDLNLQSACADLGLALDECNSCIRGSQVLLQNLGGLLSGGNVTRGTWDTLFKEAVAICRVDVED